VLKADKSLRWIIRSMQMADLAFAAECTAAEGWASETYATFEGFYQHDPNGCFLAELAGRPAGICIATPYGRSGFVGELIVRPEARGRGIGAALLNHAVEYLRRHGAVTVYLDGVVKAVPLYERNGFRKICRSLRFSGTLGGESRSDVRAMRTDDLPAVFALDRQAFGVDRSFLLARRLQLFQDLCQVMVEDGKLTGYILGRRGEGWAAAGPWVIAQEARAPLRLLESLARQVGDVSISVGVLETNRRAVELIRSLGSAVRQDSPWRMALGPSGDLGASPLCFAVGAAATG
jgi:ribosomal protein S18 acetylase RimI-like enzyme